ncbi:MAG: hypothetical protein QOJ40_969 [Verrucomicrobiota bacterium]
MKWPQIFAPHLVARKNRFTHVSIHLSNLKIQDFIVRGVMGCLLACLADSARSAEIGGMLRDFVVRTWTKAERLPDDSVTTLLQTHDGYLWIGAGSGLVRFDGVKFTAVPLSASDSKRPVSITALCEDAADQLWIGSQEQGLFCRLAGVVRQYRKAEGLLDDTVTSLTTDSEGRVWIGTPHGLNRWDGKKFAAFTRRDGLPDDSIFSVRAAHSGSVWITTRGGICRFLQGRIDSLHLPAEEQERDSEFLEAYEDVRSNLWAFSTTYLINITNFNEFVGLSTNLPAGTHAASVQVAEGRRINYFPGEKSASTRIWSLCEGRGGRLWIGASGRGVFCFDGVNFQPIMLNEGRWPNDVRAICEDHEGNLWLGISGGGLTQLQPQSFVLLKNGQGLPAGAVTCLTLDSGGRVCVGLESGGLFAKTGDRFERLPDDARSLAQDVPSSLCAGSDGSLWVGTFGTGLYRLKGGRTAQCTTANGLSDDCVLAVCADAEGTVWAGTQAGMLHQFANGGQARFTTKEGLPGAPITALLPARQGGLWIGTSDGKLLRGDAHFGNVATVKLAPRLNGKPILGLYESMDRTLWIGTGGGGLGRLDANGCSAWDSQDGLPDDLIFGVVADAEDNLWLTTSKGLCRVPRSSTAKPRENGAMLRAKLLFETEASSNQSLNFGWPRALRSAEGRLWFATASGLAGIDTHAWQTEKPAPKVHIEAVLVDNRPVNLVSTAESGRAQPRSPVQLPAGLRALEFQFTALSFEAPEKVRFRHKLDRFDADWIETGPERHVQYGRLGSGSYEFHVTACNAEGVWNEIGAVLPFIIPTPLWRAPWVLGLYALSAAGAVAGAVRLVSHRRLRRRLARLEQQQAMERERVRIAHDMHDEIGSKLTKISFLSERAKVDADGSGALAEKIDSIADTSRELLQALDEIVWAVNPRNDNLEQLGAYLSQYAREYFNNTAVECDVSLAGGLPQMAMSAELRHNLFLAFEESLSNVLKHSGASRVRVQIRVEAQSLQIIVTDEGRGFEVPPEQPGLAAGISEISREGNGLINMRQRLADAGGHCSIVSRVGHGTTVTLSISLASAKLREQ